MATIVAPPPTIQRQRGRTGALPAKRSIGFIERDPIRFTYRGNTVISMPPPSSGGATMAEMLKILEGYDVRFLNVARRHYPEHFGYAHWYYEGDDFPSLQCVWPDKHGRFPTDAD